MFSNLYRPGRIGTLAIRNRIVMAAMHTALSDGGAVNRAVIEYFGQRARGGTGLIVVGAAGVDPELVNTRNVIGAYHDRFISGLARLCAEIHSGGSRCFLQLFHPGRYGKSAEYENRMPVAPSAVPSGFTGETPRALTEKETETVIGHYAEAARRAGEAGFDGVEITAASGYLPAQFLSPLTNQRTDRFGGGLDGRLTFLKEIVRRIRITMGRDFPLAVRLGGSDLIPGGHTIDEAILIAVALEKEGIDAISLTGGWHESAVPQLTMDVPPGALTFLAAKMKKALTVPLIHSNRLTPKIAEELVDSGLIDFAAFGRALLADPSMPIKAAAGRHDSIRPCVACNQGCMDRIFSGDSIRCLVNPEAGRETLLSERGPLQPEASRTILVVGGGVAGLNYAAEASRRGHRPVVWEKEWKVGGQAALASNLQERRETARYVEYLAHLCLGRGIPLITGKEADVKSIQESVKRGEFDSVVLATGKMAGPSNLETDGTVPVCHGWEVLRGNPVPANKIVIKGGEALGIWTALKLAARGRITAEQYRFLNLYDVDRCDTLKGALNDFPGTITMVTSGKAFGSDMGKSSKWVYLDILKRLRVMLLREREIVNIRDHSVIIKNRDGETQDIDADIIIETESFIPGERELDSALREAGIDVSLVGDALSPGNMFSAVDSGYLEGSSRE